MLISKYIVTFCNNKQNNGSRGLIGQFKITSNNNVYYEDIDIKGLGELNPKGVTGICHYGSGYVALLQSVIPHLVYFDKEFNVLKAVNISQFKGIHTIIIKGKKIYLAITGEDSVCVTNDGRNFKTVWSNKTNQDTIHLNSICFFKNTLLFSAFGEKSKGALWGSASNGFIRSTKQQSNVIKKKIWHPHSLVSWGNDIYYCHSSNQSIESLEGFKLENLPGYTRGLSINEKFIVCGTSIGRLVSHSTGVKVSNLSGMGDTGGKCGVYFFNKRYNSDVFYDLSEVATEVFEVIPKQSE